MDTVVSGHWSVVTVVTGEWSVVTGQWSLDTVVSGHWCVNVSVVVDRCVEQLHSHCATSLLISQQLQSVERCIRVLERVSQHDTQSVFQSSQLYTLIIMCYMEFL